MFSRDEVHQVVGRCHAGPRAERRVLARLSKDWDDAWIGQDLISEHPSARTSSILETPGMHSKFEAATLALHQ